MTKHDLKELAAIGAELGAAKAEVERLRGLLWKAADHIRDSSKLRDLNRADFELLASIKAALSEQEETATKLPLRESVRASVDLAGNRFEVPVSGWADAAQAEPTDTFTAVDMATAAAQGFRDGPAAVEPATAQDELVVYRAVNQFGSDCHFGVESLARVWAGPKGTVERVTLKPAPDLSVVAVHPAQTAPQPEQSGLVEALEEIASGLQAEFAWEVAEQALAAYRAALSAQGAGDASA